MSMCMSSQDPNNSTPPPTVRPIGGSAVIQLRDELRRLRAENDRLTRLLDVRGQHTAPAPEQPTAGLAPSGVVTMDSPVADKLALYADLFHARTDVHAVRWENDRTGGSRWMPAVAGGWPLPACWRSAPDGSCGPRPARVGIGPPGGSGCTG